MQIAGRLCVVIGGGGIAERKVKSLLRFGAAVRVISPRITKPLGTLYEKGKIELELREFRSGDTDGAVLVFAATNDRTINSHVNAEARSRSALVNVVDDPDLCEFIVPSIIRGRSITIAISTSGAAPMASKKIRKQLESSVKKDFSRYARIVAKVRQRMKTQVPRLRDRKRLLEVVATMEINEVNSLGVAGVLARLFGQTP